MQAEKKAFSSEMCHSRELELELGSAESDVRSGMQKKHGLKNKSQHYVKIDSDTTSEQVLALLDVESDEIDKIDDL